MPARRLFRLGLLAALLAASSAGAYDWTQFGGDAAHSGLNTREATLTRNNVASSTLLFQATLPARTDGVPVVQRYVATASGLQDVLYVTTVDGTLYALNARTGLTIWSRSYGPGSCKINNGSNTCYTTSSPAIDPSGLFVYTYGLDGFVHKLQAGDGVEVTTPAGWPQSATLKGYDEKGSSALAIATIGGTSYLYVTHGGYPGDAGDYQGHVTAINLVTGAQNVFNTMCSNQARHLAHNDPSCLNSRQTAVWARPGAVYDARTNRLLFATGNSSVGGFTGNTGGFNWSESVLAIKPDGTAVAGKPVDSYTPTNFASLDSGDTDVGSTAPVILPVPAASAIASLGVQSGKDGKLRLLDLGDLSGQGAPGHVGGEIGAPINVPQGGGIFSQPAVWRNPADGSSWFFIGNGSGSSGVRIDVDVNGMPSLQPQWTKTTRGTSPVVANNMVFMIDPGTNSLRALDPLTGSPLWQSASFGGVHWQGVTVANGVVYAADQSGHITAFAPPVAPAKLDFDAGGKTDLVWRNASAGTTSLWLMNGASLAAGATLVTNPDWSVTHTGDFNGDGKADLLWRNATTGETAIWLMNGGTLASGAIVMANTAWQVVAVGDFNGDGKSDLVWHNQATGQTALWIMNGTALASGGIVLTSTDWSVVKVGDFNGDGRSDLIWRNAATGATALWLMDGAAMASGAIVRTDPNWSVAATGDFDGDGQTDLVWHNSASGATEMWLMAGSATVKSVTLLTDPAWTVTGVGDFDGDGRSDLVWRNGTTGITSVWLMAGTAASAAATVMADGTWQAVHVGDFNGDRKADLVFRNSVSGDTAVAIMNGTTLVGGGTVMSGNAWTVTNPD